MRQQLAFMRYLVNHRQRLSHEAAQFRPSESSTERPSSNEPFTTQAKQNALSKTPLVFFMSATVRSPDDSVTV